MMKALEKKIGNLNCMKEENQVASVDAYPQLNRSVPGGSEWLEPSLTMKKFS